MGMGAPVEQRLTQLWYREQPRPSLLQPLGWLYGAAMRVRRRAYASGWARSEDAGVPVVVVGNFTVGGTGKTPLTIWLAQKLTGRGFSVGVVSRGYGRRGGGAACVVEAQSDWREVGDEPLILARRSGCVTVVATDRIAGARLLAARGANLVLADDGLQHLRLARACEIVVVDGARGFGNGRVLPAGPLREPLTRPLRADAVVVNGEAAHASLLSWPGAREALTMHLVAQQAVRLDGAQAPRTLESFRDLRVHAVAGIGNPQRFFRELRTRGLEVIEHAYPDHHPFTAGELAFADELPVLMTEKDAVKCASFANARLWYVPVAAQFSDADARELFTRVLAKLPATPALRGNR
jgi:tetraacyldisaccharide 4'-kinase